MKKLTLGIIAHVDSGKTTLSEGLLYLTGAIRKHGRVDHGDAFLDTFRIERERGITVFSKQARFSTDKMEITLLDTPGHSDFSAETERTFSVLDYCILVISGTDGVQAHTETLWHLLKKYGVPTFVFVNKTDLVGFDRSAVMDDLRKRLGEGFIDFNKRSDDFEESLALCDESLLEKYMETGKVFDDDITVLIKRRCVFPCFFGSALKLEGIEELICALEKFTAERNYPDIFGARVYKISRDEQGKRLTHLKITGGALSVRAPIKYTSLSGEEKEEKTAQIRLYSGTKFEQVDTVSAGEVCAVSGLTLTYPGLGLGFEENSAGSVLEPVLSYSIILPDGCDARSMYPKLLELQEEDPQLHLSWDDRLSEIRVRLMGKVQTEILKSTISDRFGIDVEFDEGQILYMETIENTVEGVGHYEPLRHYSEVHLLLEPLKRGSGLIFKTDCSEDTLDRNWQRLIMTHLLEKTHLGVLTGSPITDMKITLKSGRAHLKHTEGGDFRQSTYRAVRQGLMTAKSVLLEPVYAFTLTIPSDQTGRAINDIRMMNGTFDSPETIGDMTVMRGRAPVSAMRNYMSEVITYTRGRGSLNCIPDGYEVCANAEKIIEEIGYNPEADLENTPDSVFCAHGAGFNVKWNEVPEYMHLESCLKAERADEVPKLRTANLSIDDKELEAIMTREFGPIKRPSYGIPSVSSSEHTSTEKIKTEYLIIDGYNVIFGWDELKKLAEADLSSARDKLMDILSNYKNFKNCELVLVFDGYRVKSNPGEKFDFHGIHVAYTKEGQTGDMFIEKLANDIGRNFAVRVVTSDNLIRLSALRAGVLRISTKEFRDEVNRVNVKIEEILKKQNESFGKENFSLDIPWLND